MDASLVIRRILPAFLLAFAIGCFAAEWNNHYIQRFLLGMPTEEQLLYQVVDLIENLPFMNEESSAAAAAAESAAVEPVPSAEPSVA